MIPEQLITRNRENIIEVSLPSFWINDIEQHDGGHKIEVSYASLKNWLHVNQSHSETCYVLPIDGKFGVFVNTGLPVNEPDDFMYDWKTKDSKTGKPIVKSARAGDCDCLIIHKEWHLLEFKTDASSLDIDQIENNTRKAVAQLAKSLISFRQHYETLPSTICVMVSPNIYPKITSSMVTQMLKFNKKYETALKIIRANEKYVI